MLGWARPGQKILSFDKFMVLRKFVHAVCSFEIDD